MDIHLNVYEQLSKINWVVILGNFFNHINTISELSIGKARKAWTFITKCCDAWVRGHGMSTCSVMFSRMFVFENRLLFMNECRSLYFILIYR